MGAGTDNTPQEFAPLLVELLEEQRKTNRLLSKKALPWCTPDEAAEMLGKRITRSGQHRRVLKYARDKNWLTVFGQTNPFTYSRSEVLKLQTDVLAGRKVLP